MRRRFSFLTATLAGIVGITAGLSGFLCSCQFFEGADDAEELVLTLPEWPPQGSIKERYPPLSRWEITMVNATLSEPMPAQTEERPSSGISEGYAGGIPLTTFFTDEGSLAVRFTRNSPAAIMARPVVLIDQTAAESAFFAPAGLLYPYRKESLTWEEGFLAHCLQRLLRSGEETGMSREHILAYAARFNWKKAQESIEKKLAQHGNPWLIDDFQILDNISYGEFKASFLNASSCITADETILERCGIKESDGTLPILSSFIPENEFIQAEKSVIIKKNSENLFYSGQDYGIILQGSSLKNLSAGYVKLPIFIEEDADDT